MQNCELVFLRVIHRTNRNLLFAVFANFAFAFHTLFAFRAYPKNFIAHSTLFALKLLVGRNHAVRSRNMNRAKISVQNLHPWIHAPNKTKTFLVPIAINVLYWLEIDDDWLEIKLFVDYSVFLKQ